jgi:3',5'-cyclic AMP phosphodiesterase CpdA
MTDFVQFGTTASFALAALPGPGTDQGVLRFAALEQEQTVLVKPNLGGTGTIDTWTIGFDILVPAGQGTWTAFLQTDPTNTDSDGELFIRRSSPTEGGIGISGQYDGSFQYGTWERVVFTAETAGGTTTLKKYIDGTLVGTQGLSGDRWKLDAEDGFLIVSDNDGDVSSGFLSSFLFAPAALSEAEVAALGTPDADGFAAAAPVAGASQFDFTGASYAATFGPATMTAPGDTDPPAVPPLAVENRLMDAMDTVGTVLTYDLADVFNRDDVTITVESDDEAVATVAIDGDMLSVTLNALGHADLKVTATDADGNTATDNLRVRAAGENAYTIVVVPDTQDYTDASLTNGPPETFYGMMQWLMDNEESHNIVFVTHVGDITQDNLDFNWEVANEAFSMLDGVLPYALPPGNHDQALGGSAADHTTDFLDDIFSPTRQATTNPDTFGGVYDQEPDRSANTFHTFEGTDGTKWLLLGIEFGPRDDVIRWATDVIEDHLDHQVIVSSHGLTNWPDRQNPASAPVYDEGAGYDYGMGRDPEGANDAETLWREVLSRYSNVAFTFSGHIFGDGAQTDESWGQHGNRVVESLVNYQNGVAREITGNGNPAQGGLGGNGAMRLVTIDPDNDRVTTETYFSALDEYLDGFRVSAELDRDGLTGLYRGHEEVFENWDLSTPETRPVAMAGDDQFVAAGAGADEATVTLDAGDSIVPGGPDVEYVWLDANGDEIATGETADVALGVGRHAITLVVTDDEGHRSADTLLVIVTGDGTKLLDNFNDGDIDGWALPGLDFALEFGAPADFGLPALPGGDDIVVEIPALTPTQALTLTPNFGAPSGTLIGDYSLVFDILVPDGQGTWTSFIQLDVSNTSDGELFIRNRNDGTGGIGIGGQYDGNFQYGEWQRVAFVFDDQNNGTTILKKYIDGALVGTQNLSGDRWKFDASAGALLFTDEDGETSDVYVNSVLLTEKVFTDAEILALGSAVSGGVLAGPPTPLSTQFDFNGDLDATFGVPTLSFGEIGAGTGNFIVKGTVFARDTAEEGLPAPEGRVYEQSDTENNVLFWGDEAALDWSDYVLELTFRSTDNDGIGALFYWQDADNHYRIELNGETNLRTLVRVADGVETVLAEETGGTRFNVDQELKVAIVGDAITVFVDDMLLFGGAVIDGDPLAAGSVGLWSDQQRSSQFDNVTVNHAALDAHAGSDQRLFDLDGDGAESVTLSATGTFGPAALVTFEWRDDEGNLLATGETVTFDLAVGLNALTLSVTDADGAIATDRVDVEVVGTSRIWIAEDFAGTEIPEGWTIVDEGEFGGAGEGGTASDWAVEDGRLVQNSDLKSRELTWQGASNADVWKRGWSPHGDGVKVLRLGTYALYEGEGADEWEDYSIEATITSPDNEGLGFLVHYVDADNYYKLELDAEGVYDRNPGNGAGPVVNLIRKQDGIEEILGQIPVRYTPGEDFKLRLDVQDNKLSAFLNGEALFAYAIEDRGIEAGTVGLYSWGSEGVAFDDVRVVGLDATEEPVATPELIFLQGVGGFPPGRPAPPPADPALVAAKVEIDTGAELNGKRYTLVENEGLWNEIKSAGIAAGDYLPAMGEAFAFANFVDLRLDLAAALDGLDLLLVGAKRGAVTGSGFADLVEWIAHSNGGSFSEVMTIDAGDGDDVIIVRAVVSSDIDDTLLADNPNPSNGRLWRGTYDGRVSVAEVDGGAGDDVIQGFDRVQLVAEGGEGDDIGQAGDGTQVSWVLAGLRDGYAITAAGDQWQIEDIDASDGDTGTDLIGGFERVRFADGSILEL